MASTSPLPERYLALLALRSLRLKHCELMIQSSSGPKQLQPQVGVASTKPDQISRTDRTPNLAQMRCPGECLARLRIQRKGPQKLAKESRGSIELAR